MIKSFNILYSQKSDLLDVKRRFPNYPSDKTLIQVFSGQIKKRQIERLLHDLKDVFQGVPIIGTTTAGEIFDGKVLEKTIVVNIDNNFSE